MIEKIKMFVRGHKVATGAALIVAIFLLYFIYTKFTSTSGETRYVTATVEKGTITTSVTGTGQVSVLSQVDMKTKASGDVVKVSVTEGQTVKAGALVAQLDATDALKAVRDAKANLDSAKIALAKLQEPADALSYTQTQNALTEANQTKDTAESDLKKSYDDAFTAISNAFLQLPNVVTGVNDILYQFSYNPAQKNIDYFHDLVKDFDVSVDTYQSSADSTYQAARTAYDKNFLDYKATSRYADTADIEKILDETYETTKSIAEAVKSTENYLSFVKDRLTEHNYNIPAQLLTQQTSLATYTDQINTNLVNLFNAKNTIKNLKDTLTTSDLTIKEKSDALTKLVAGADPLDVQSAKLTIVQRQNALYDANTSLGDYSVRAPFDGVIANLSVQKGQTLGSGTSVASLVTNQRLAQISLNEVDVAKIKVGDKAVLTFDAIDGLSLTGEVQVIDTLGTVSQGVVSYNVKIGFDSQDDRVKVGMSVSASIITEVKQDVLLVPNGAVKSQGSSSYVEMFDTPLPASSSSNQGATSSTPPKRQPVETGLSNDDSTEIVTGLKEGDQIVVKTVTVTPSTTTSASAPSLFGGGGGGGATRALTNPGR